MMDTKHRLLTRVLKRNSFLGLMDLYENNYTLLQRLLQDVNNLPERGISMVPGSPDLHYTVLERCKFTTTLSLTYYFINDQGQALADPDLIVRIYHDARQAEAMSCCAKSFMQIPMKHEHDKPVVDCKWDNNILLLKWLEYTISLGHSFAKDGIQSCTHGAKVLEIS